MVEVGWPIGKLPDEYGDKYYDHLLEQYKLYVEMADNVSERRQSANNYFLAIDSALISLYGILSGLNLTIDQYKYFISITGIFVSIVWLTLINSYRQLNSRKFKVIQMIETKLPIAPYSAEWKITDKYIPFTYVEQIVPIIFLVVYVYILYMVDIKNCV